MRAAISTRLDGPSCSPLMATNHSRAPAPGLGGTLRDIDWGAGGRLTSPLGSSPLPSRTVMTFSQVLQRIFRIFCRTLSSAMEYRVWQRSQTNFIRDFRRLAAPRAGYYSQFAGGAQLYNLGAE